MKGLSSYRRAAKVLDLSKYQRFVKISKICQNIKGLSIHEVFVNTNMERLSIKDLSRYEGFVKRMI